MVVIQIKKQAVLHMKVKNMICEGFFKKKTNCSKIYTLLLKYANIIYIITNHLRLNKTKIKTYLQAYYHNLVQNICTITLEYNK